MKKTIKKSSLRKWVVGGIAAFGSIALLTTGFATWVIGANNTTDTDGTDVTVDTAVRNNVSLEITLKEAKVYIGEDLSKAEGSFINGKAAEGGEEGTQKATDEGGEEGTQKATDFSITMNITLEVGKDVGTFSTINFDFAYDYKVNNQPVENDATNNNKVNVPTNLPERNWRKAGDYTFLKIAKPTLNLPTTAETPVDGITLTTDDEGNKKYTATGLEVKIFDWGTFFGGKAPSTYYNEIYDNGDGTLTNSTADVNAVYDEFQALSEAFNGKKIYIKAEVK